MEAYTTTPPPGPTHFLAAEGDSGFGGFAIIVGIIMILWMIAQPRNPRPPQAGPPSGPRTRRYDPVWDEVDAAANDADTPQAPVIDLKSIDPNTWGQNPPPPPQQ